MCDDRKFAVNKVYFDLVLQLPLLENNDFEFVLQSLPATCGKVNNWGDLLRREKCKICLSHYIGENCFRDVASRFLTLFTAMFC